MATATDQPTLVRAQVRHLRCSARKARVILDHVRGMSVMQAEATLQFSPRAAARDDNARDTTRTMKMESVGGRAVAAPAARAIVSDTRMPLSRQFDSAAAVERLAVPAKADRALLARAPRTVGVWRRVLSDPGPRLLLIAALVGALLASCIVSG